MPFDLKNQEMTARNTHSRVMATSGAAQPASSTAEKITYPHMKAATQAPSAARTRSCVRTACFQAATHMNR